MTGSLIVHMRRWFVAMAVSGLVMVAGSGRAAGAEIPVLFLGDNGHHQPAARASELTAALGERGIAITYADSLEALSLENLKRYRALIIYANYEAIAPEQEQALLDYVAGGGGFVPIHCASYCFHNSPKYIELVGAEFARHGTGEFVAEITDRAHPITEDLLEFGTWDETYVHTKHNPDRQVLMERAEGEGREPWTWVRTHGKGRVFYTAYGHDGRTFTNPGFQQLIEHAIRWVSGETVPNKPKAPFSYQDAKIPFYPPSGAPGIRQEAPTQMQLPLDPEASLTHMRLPADFEARLYASEPDIVKVIAMNWDERGRLWAAETVDYPNDLKAPPNGQDRIRICEDTDGDGRADRFTVFADHLSIPTGLAFARGGLIVVQAPDTLFLKDTDGDGVADVREVLFSGWGTKDTHSGPSNLRMGLDNWIWGTVGYSGFEGAVGGTKHQFRMGVFRFRPDGSDLEFVAPTTNNTWGLGLSETGEVFVSTANGDHHDFMAIPNRYFEGVRGLAGHGLAPIFDHKNIHPVTGNVRQVDWHGQFTAAAGCALYTARTYPAPYWNRAAFITEPTGHLVHQCFIEPDGSDFVAHDGWNLLASADEWTSPVAAEVGPDGNMWVSDWYNYIVQHNPTPKGFENGPGNAYVTPLRDHSHGRIYRIAYTRATSESPPNLRAASDAMLLAALGHPNLLWRMHAQRLIVDEDRRGLIQELAKLAMDKTLDAIGNAPTALHALSALDGLGFFDSGEATAGQLVEASLRHPAPAVRRRAAQIAPRFPGMAGALIAQLSDGDPRVRLQGLLSLSEMAESPAAGEAIASLLNDAATMSDAWLPDGVIISGAAHAEPFLMAASGLPNAAAGDARVLEAVAAVVGHYARGERHPKLAALLQAYTRAPRPLSAAVLGGLGEHWPEGTAPEAGVQEALAAYGALNEPGLLLGALRLGRRWGLELGFDTQLAGLHDVRLAVLADASQANEDRLAAAADLFVINGGAARALVLDQVTPQAAPAFTERLFGMLLADGAPDCATEILARFESFTPAVRTQALDILLARPEWSLALLDAMDTGALAPPAFSVVQKRTLLDAPDEGLRSRARQTLAASHGTVNADRAAIVESHLPLAHQEGDTALGRQVFSENCMACHTFAGEGGNVGPDLTGIAGGNREEILTAILDPNRSVEGNFRQWTVETADGLFYSGLLAQENQTSFGIYDARGALHTILREDVENLSQSNLSVMPEGFEALPAEQLAGLLAYLTTPQDYLPLDLRPAANTISTLPMFTGARNDDPYFERFLFDNWGVQRFDGVPYFVASPGNDDTPNLIMLNSPHSPLVRQKPKSASVACNRSAAAIHLLSGVSGWGFPIGTKGSVSMIVRLHYADGTEEDHELLNGVHFADYIRVVEVPESRLAFQLGPRQLRQLTVVPKRDAVIESIEFVKGGDESAPMVMAVTLALKPSSS